MRFLDYKGEIIRAGVRMGEKEAALGAIWTWPV